MNVEEIKKVIIEGPPVAKLMGGILLEAIKETEKDFIKFLQKQIDRKEKAKEWVEGFLEV